MNVASVTLVAVNDAIPVHVFIKILLGIRVRLVVFEQATVNVRKPLLTTVTVPVQTLLNTFLGARMSDTFPTAVAVNSTSLTDNANMVAIQVALVVRTREGDFTKLATPTAVDAHSL